MAAHVEFIPLESETKTKKWRVSAKSDGFRLGEIKWFARWYQYSFFPDGDTVFEKTCLRDIAQFCEDETKKRRATWGKRKTVKT